MLCKNLEHAQLWEMCSNYFLQAFFFFFFFRAAAMSPLGFGSSAVDTSLDTPQFCMQLLGNTAVHTQQLGCNSFQDHENNSFKMQHE